MEGQGTRKAAAYKPQKLHFFEDFILGGAAAVISKTSAAPFERTKLILQNQPELVRSGVLEKPFTGVVDCITKTFRNEGFLSF